MAKQNTSFAPSLLPTSGKIGGSSKAISTRPSKANFGKSFNAQTATMPQGMTPNQARVATNVMHSGKVNPLGIYNAMTNKKNDESQNSKTIDRRTFFDDRNSGDVTFGLGLDNKLFPITKRLNDKTDSRLHILYKEFRVGLQMNPASNAYDEFRSNFTRLKAMVNKEVNNSSVLYFTIQNYSDYLQAVFRAVALYYGIDSIMSYGPKSNSQFNMAIETARNMLANNPIVLTEQNRLRRALIGHYLPKNLFKFAQKFGQFHRLGEADESGAFVIDISSVWFKMEGTNVPKFADPTILQMEYDAIIQNLYDQVNKQNASIIGILSKVKPEWEICDMPLSTNHAQFDVNLATIFSNARTVWITPTSGTPVRKYYPDPVTDQSVMYNFNLQSDPSQVDGYVEALLNFDTNAEYNGIWQDKTFLQVETSPVNNLAMNKAYFSIVDSMNGTIECSKEADEYVQRGDTFNVDVKADGTVNFKFTVTHDGKYRAFIINKEGTELNLRNVIDLLYSI